VTSLQNMRRTLFHVKRKELEHRIELRRLEAERYVKAMLQIWQQEWNEKRERERRLRETWGPQSALWWSFTKRFIMGPIFRPDELHKIVTV